MSMTEAADALTDPFLAMRADGPVGTIRLTMPQTRNALSTGMLTALGAALDAYEADPAIRVMVIEAEGPAFSAGHDLKEVLAAKTADDRGHSAYEALFALCSEVMLKIVHHPKPVIAKVEGVAAAAGCQLVATCDLAYASPAARFTTPGVHIGLFCSTPMVALARNVARKHAMAMLLTGEMIDAEAAARIGLVNAAVPDGAIDAHVQTVAMTIASKSPLTLKIGKRAFYEQAEMSLSDAYAYTARVMTENMMTHDAAEGISAFVEKREPRWEGR